MGWIWVEKFNLYLDMGHRDRVRDRDKGGGNVNVI